METAKKKISTITKDASIRALKSGKLQQKAAGDIVKNYLKKHGGRSLLRKIGWKAAARLGIGAVLSGTGVGTLAGVAMTAWQVAEIAKMLRSAAKDSSGLGIMQEPKKTRRGIRI